MRGTVKLAAVTLLACAACLAGPPAKSTTEPAGEPAARATASLPVFCSIAPQAFLIERVGGDAVSVSVLVGPGQSPHTFEPTPKQMAQMASARLYFSVGLPFERELLERATALNPNLTVVDMVADVRRRQMESGLAHHDDGDRDEGYHVGGSHGREEETGAPDAHAGLPDPHVWLDPRNAAAMATAARDALVSVMPGEKAALDARLDTLLADLDELYAELQISLAPLKGGRLYVFHPAFGYFTDAFGLEQVPVEVGGTEPGPRELAALIGRARADHVRVIFVQPQFSKRSASAIAREIGGVVVPIDPLSGDYIGNLRAIAREVRVGIGAGATGSGATGSGAKGAGGATGTAVDGRVTGGATE